MTLITLIQTYDDDLSKTIPLHIRLNIDQIGDKCKYSDNTRGMTKLQDLKPLTNK